MLQSHGNYHAAIAVAEGVLDWEDDVPTLESLLPEKLVDFILGAVSLLDDDAKVLLFLIHCPFSRAESYSVLPSPRMDASLFCTCFCKTSSMHLHLPRLSPGLRTCVASPHRLF